MLPFVALPEFCIDGNASEPRFRLSMGSRLALPLASAMPKGIALSGDAFAAVSDRGSLQFSGVHFCSPCYFALRFQRSAKKLIRRETTGILSVRIEKAIFNCSRKRRFLSPPDGVGKIEKHRRFINMFL